MNKNEKNILKAIKDKKAINVKFYDVRGINPLCDSIIVCSALNERNLVGIKDSIEDAALSNKMKINHIEGRNNSKWIVVDLNDIVVHVMTEDERARVDLDSIIVSK